MEKRMNTNKISKLISILFLVLPVFVLAQGSFVPCVNDCGYSDLLKLVNNIINWIIMISFPVAAGVFAWAGFKLMTTGIADERSAAKAMLWKVFIGFIFILSAWIIVTTITNTFLSPDFKSAVPVEGVK